MGVEVKICGLSTAETLEAALVGGADYVGMVFYPPSPRNVDLKTAQSLARLSRGRGRIVALVVDASDSLLASIATTVMPDYFQAHGQEDPARIAAMANLTERPVIKAIKVNSPTDVDRAHAFRDVADMILFDAKAPESLGTALPGGNGIAFDWTLLGPSGRQRRFMLSGGLNAANVAQAIALTRAPIVDVSSGVESAPGIKDPGLIRNFIEAARAPR